MRIWIRAACAGACLASLTACAHVKAAPVVPVALDVPQAPARVVVPVVLAEPEATPPAPPAPAPPPATAPRTTATRPVERPAAPPAAAPAPAPETPQAPPAVLQTTSDTGALERSTHDLLNEAQRSLSKVKRQDLRTQARDQYDQAVGFIRSANEALRIKNYVLAERMAEKAQIVARELAK